MAKVTASTLGKLLGSSTRLMILVTDSLMNSMDARDMTTARITIDTGSSFVRPKKKIDSDDNDDDEEDGDDDDDYDDDCNGDDLDDDDNKT